MGDAMVGGWGDLAFVCPRSKTACGRTETGNFNFNFKGKTTQGWCCRGHAENKILKIHFGVYKAPLNSFQLLFPWSRTSKWAKIGGGGGGGSTYVLGLGLILNIY